MAIVTISRIQHRRGLYDNLPQLAAAEFGWAADERRLFIGNGPVSEGAPEVGNTEILTEFSDLLSVVQTYTFQNPDAGYVPTTGPTSNAPVMRTLQQKLDDFVSVKDFGAKGDGETDDTAAINRALYQLYCVTGFQGAFKTLHFPAGRYIISNWIKIPPYATLMGEGPNSTILIQTANPAVTAGVMVTADSKQQIFGSIGTNGGSLPTDIQISNMSITTALNGLYIYNCRRITVDRVRLVGPDVSPVGTSSIASVASDPSLGIVISGNTTNPSEDINLVDIHVSQFNYGIWQNSATTPDQFFRNVVISSGTFEYLYEGLYLCVSQGSAKNISVTGTVFDKIYYSAVHVGNMNNFTSSFNYYRDVGTGYSGAGNPLAYIINFGSATNHSASLGDLFDRTTADDLVVESIHGNTNTAYIEYGNHLAMGYLVTENGNEDTLTNNVTNASTSIALKLARYQHAQITYSIKRGVDVRSGILNLSFDGTTGYTIDDDSTQTSDVGVTFGVSIAAGIATVIYTTTNTGSAATLRYSVKRLNDVV